MRLHSRMQPRSFTRRSTTVLFSATTPGSLTITNRKSGWSGAKGWYRDKSCTHGRDASVAMQMLEESLGRLGTDHLDLWQLHAVVYDNYPELAYRAGAIEALERAKKRQSPLRRLHWPQRPAYPQADDQHGLCLGCRAVSDQRLRRTVPQFSGCNFYRMRYSVASQCSA
jgi:hypothetical protein